MTARVLAFAPSAGAPASAPKRPEPIVHGLDTCACCRRTIGDDRFSAVVVTVEGRSVKFDSIECLLVHQGRVVATNASAVWVSDFRRGVLLDANSARFVNLGFGRTPMGCGWAAVATARDAAAIGVIDIGRIRCWSDLQ